MLENIELCMKCLHVMYYHEIDVDDGLLCLICGEYCG